VHEGGIASPLIAAWPAGIRDRGKLRHDPCHFVDVLPTLVDLAGGKPQSPSGPPLAGVSWAPAFARNGSMRREHLYFHHNNNRALRVGDWKLIATGQQGPWELYNIARDRCELRNEAARRPETVSKMAAQWQSIEDEFIRTREAAPPSTRPLLNRQT
jgi:arylsulfatase